MSNKYFKPLSEFKLYYEDLVKSRKMKKTTKQPVKIKVNKFDAKSKIKPVYDKTRRVIVSVVKKTKHPRKPVRKVTKTERETRRNERNRAILGIGLLLVVASIAYSTYVVFIGVDSIASRVSLLPQALFATITLLKAFSKLYK